MFKIGEFSKLCQVPTSVLRYYDEFGLFKPASVDPFTGYRYYSLDQLPRLNRILALRDLDLSLSEIDQIINDQIAVDEIKGMLRLKQVQLTRQQTEVQAKLQRVNMRLKQIESENSMPEYEVVVKKAEAMKIASIRELVPAADQMPSRCGAMFEAIINWLETQQHFPAGPSLAMYYNPEYVETDIEVENAFVVNSNLENGWF
jgi:DNA-binding transcriptional MerR regulator